MSEAWVLEMLGATREAARANGLLRLAEHLDDAILLAASEYHEAVWMQEATEANVFEGAGAVRVSQGPSLH
jgi:hypothetical protein